MKNAFTNLTWGVRTFIYTIIFACIMFLLMVFTSCKTAPDWHTLPMAQSKAHLKTVKHIKSQKYCHFTDLYEYKYIKKTK